MLRSAAAPYQESNAIMKHEQLESSQPPPGGPGRSLATLIGCTSAQRAPDFRLFWD